MVTTEWIQARKAQQERLGNVLGGVALIGIGAYFMAENGVGATAVTLWHW
jgi:hypothetical protein